MTGQHLATGKRIAIIVSIVVVGFYVLQVFVKGARFDLINSGGYGPSSSASKEESVTRGVYIADLKVVSLQLDPMDLEIEDAWIEKVWRAGKWYWTTKPDAIGCQIVINGRLNNEEGFLRLLTSDYENGYLGCHDDRCSGMLRRLPANDTLVYNVMKLDNLDHTESNVRGNLIMVVTNRKSD